ncbi:hypothetical protein CBOM_03680 [Ceraceosorus bombacis]|uniref:Uncharacterized protein n=1 Tax=Ceraceosorus bombacis TaxID=401625 RepID=A0A0N7LA20_9BASI|nr:hypothetical protein CBOM_03680 [Ceraceosorus bombacis]
MSTMTASSTMATGPGTEHALDLYGPSSIPPPSNSGVPTWEDEIVPALRKRLEAESARLGKRMSRLDQAGSDGWVPLGAEQVARKVAAETYNGQGSKKNGPIASTSEWGISSAHHATPNAARYAAVITSASGRREASDQARSFTQPADLTAYRQNRQAPASTSKAESVRRAREKADAYRQRSGDDSWRSRAREEEEDSAGRLYADLTSSEATGLALASAAALGVGSAHHPPSGSTWDEVLPPAVARRVAQQKILAQGLDEGLIDAWDTKGLPLSRTQMMDLQAQAAANGPRSNNSAHMSSSNSDAVRAQAEAEERERNERADQQHRDHLARYPRAEELQHYPAIVFQQQQQREIYPPNGNRTSPPKHHDAPASTAYTSSQLPTANGKDQEKVDKGCCGCLIM